MTSSSHEGHHIGDGCFLSARLLLPLISVLFLASIGLPSTARAAYAVYADSWSSPTQAQTQAAAINRALHIASATYERATVQGRVFWRVRVGVYRTRKEARSIRRRLGDAGVSETWMRAVSDNLLPPAPVAAPKRDTTRVDSVTQATIDSLSRLARRRVDSIETAAQQRVETVIKQMRGQLTQEMLEQLEERRNRDRSLYVTQAEQAQMTRALLDEMNSHLDVIRDSLREEKKEQERLAALLPHVSGSIAARASADHERPHGGLTHSSGSVELPEAAVSIGWSGGQTTVLLDVRSNELEPVDVVQGYAVWTLPHEGNVHQQIGMGAFEAPSRLEPSHWADLLAASPSRLTARIPASYLALWFVPYESDRLRLLLFPYGAWDRSTQSGLAQVRYAWPTAFVELTAGGKRSRDASGRNRDTMEGHLVTEWRGKHWLLGLEALFERARGPVWDDYPDIIAPSNARKRADTGGLLVLLHDRFSAHWGWTLRGDVLAQTTRWWGDPALPREPIRRDWTLTTGPIAYIGSRMRIAVNYRFALSEIRPVGGSRLLRDQAHRFELGMSHVF